jgi:uncharacterized protein
VGCLPRLCRNVLLIAGLLVAAPTRAAPPPDCPPQAALPSPEQLTAGQAAARDRGFLWRIERDGQRSWLYGTLHVARLEWAFPGPQLAQVLKSARVVALELDPTDPAHARADRLEARRAAEPALPAPLRDRLARRVAAECLPPALVEPLPATLQAATLIALAGRRDGLDPAYGIDAMLAGYGHAARKPVVALETIEQQFAALFGDAPGEPLRFVEQSLDELEAGRARTQIRRIAQAWADGDLAMLETYPRWCECLETEADRALMRRLLDDRNRPLATRIEALHREGGGVLAAVGSLHFIGAQGLPALLAARGFKVERVTFPR